MNLHLSKKSNESPPVFQWLHCRAVKSRFPTFFYLLVFHLLLLLLLLRLLIHSFFSFSSSSLSSFSTLWPCSSSICPLPQYKVDPQHLRVDSSGEWWGESIHTLLYVSWIWFFSQDDGDNWGSHWTPIFFLLISKEANLVPLTLVATKSVLNIWIWSMVHIFEYGPQLVDKSQEG